jgi:hypothetical protein
MTGEIQAMQVERDVRAMNVDVISKAYDIASFYLRRTGALPEQPDTNEALLQLIVQMFERGDTRKLSLANRAIGKFESRLPRAQGVA